MDRRDSLRRALDDIGGGLLELIREEFISPSDAREILSHLRSFCDQDIACRVPSAASSEPEVPLIDLGDDEDDIGHEIVTQSFEQSRPLPSVNADIHRVQRVERSPGLQMHGSVRYGEGTQRQYVPDQPLPIVGVSPPTEGNEALDERHEIVSEAADRVVQGLSGSPTCPVLPALPGSFIGHFANRAYDIQQAPRQVVSPISLGTEGYSLPPRQHTGYPPPVTYTRAPSYEPSTRQAIMPSPISSIHASSEVSTSSRPIRFSETPELSNPTQTDTRDKTRARKPDERARTAAERHASTVCPFFLTPSKRCSTPCRFGFTHASLPGLPLEKLECFYWRHGRCVNSGCLFEHHHTRHGMVAPPPPEFRARKGGASG